jgi:hypothetical protein
MRTLALLLLLLTGFFQNTSSPVKQEQEHSKKEEKPRAEASKSAIEPATSVATPVTEPSPNTQTSEAKEKPGGLPPWSDIFWPTWVLVVVTAIAVGAALKTLGAINAQVDEMRATGEQTEKLIRENIAQSESMQRSVAEAARLASAMEVVAKEIATSSKAATASVSAINKQMRAYLSVIIGSAVYQERTKGLKFEAKPLVINAGHTPAKNVTTRSNAAILPGPSLPDDFTFPLPSEIKSTATIGAGQNAHLSAVVEDLVEDAEVEDIKLGKHPKCLWVWGIVTYEDVFGETQSSKFCQSLFWSSDNKNVFGYYYHKNNEAT